MIAPEETAEAEEFVEVEEELEDFGSDAGFDLIAAAVEGEIQADAALTEVVPDVPHTAGTFDLDDLLADVSRYPVPQRANPAPVTLQAASTEAAPVPAAPVADAPVQAEVIAPTGRRRHSTRPACSGLCCRSRKASRAAACRGRCARACRNGIFSGAAAGTGSRRPLRRP